MELDKSGGRGTRPLVEHVSILVCTRNRPDSLGRALRSLLASEDVDFELVIVDQSDGDDTCVLVHALGDERVRYHRSLQRGLGEALAYGVAQAASPFIVRTDDDCEVGPRWVVSMAAALRADPRVGLVCSNVLAAPFDASAGYVPTFERSTSDLTRSVLGTARQHGLGAGVAYRREALEAIGGFDRALGVGSRFRSCEDWDIQLRMLLRGWLIFHDASLEVVHHGFRSYAEGRRHTQDSWFGIGAMFAKLARVGPPTVLLLAVWKFVVDAVVPPVHDALRGRRPRGIARVNAFCHGYLLGLRAPVDRNTMCFVNADQGGPKDRRGSHRDRHQAAAP